MKKHYLIKRDNKIIYIKYEYLEGLSFKPVNGVFIDDGVIVAKIVIFKPEFIKLVLKKKIKNKLNLYLSLILSNEDDDEGSTYSRAFYNDITRYKALVLNRYRKYLDDRYVELLMMKIDLIEQEIKMRLSYKEMEPVSRRSR